MISQPPHATTQKKKWDAKLATACYVVSLSLPSSRKELGAASKNLMIRPLTWVFKPAPLQQLGLHHKGLNSLLNRFKDYLLIYIIYL